MYHPLKCKLNHVIGPSILLAALAIGPSISSSVGIDLGQPYRCPQRILPDWLLSMRPFMHPIVSHMNLRVLYVYDYLLLSKCYGERILMQAVRRQSVCTNLNHSTRMGSPVQKTCCICLSVINSSFRKSCVFKRLLRCMYVRHRL